MASLYIDSALFLNPSLGKQYVKQTREQTIAKYSDLQKLFPDVKDSVTGIYSSNAKVIVEFIASGSMESEETFKLPIVSIFTISRGQIVKDATYFDLENP